MKKISIMLLVFMAALASCKKTPEVNLKYVDVNRDLITVGTTTANIQCDYEYIATLKKAYFCYGEGETNMNSAEMRVVQNALYVELVGLRENTTYSYYYEFHNGFNSMQTVLRTFKTEADNGGGNEPPTPEITLPTVITASVTEVTTNSAKGGGEVTNDGGAEVTERGICWSTNANPSLNDSHVAVGTGVGAFNATVSGLNENTTYHVRAYAINEKGTAYGLDVEFATLSNGGTAQLPTIVTNSVTGITAHTAVCGGEVTNDGGAEVTERGICWGTNANPTISNSHSSAGSGMGAFSATMGGLSANTTYHVRAYATNESGTAYGSDKEFTTLGGGGSGNAPEGAINGKFTINADGDQVYFSQGNLQYQASTNTWRFAEHQWDFVGTQTPDPVLGIMGGTVSGSDNYNISSTYDGWIDLYGWGTSGWDSGNIYYHPWDTTWSIDNCHDFYGPYGNHNLTGLYAHADWGVHNSISNGGNTAETWRTLKKEEWRYLFNDRNTPSGIRFARANVCGINGLVLVPDNWSEDIFVLNNVNSSGYNHFSDNLITESQWMLLEDAGVLFLPAAGSRGDTDPFPGFVILNAGNQGHYWSSSNYGNEAAYLISFGEYWVETYYGLVRSYGFSVRLVQDASK